VNTTGKVRRIQCMKLNLIVLLLDNIKYYSLLIWPFLFNDCLTSVTKIVGYEMIMECAKRKKPHYFGFSGNGRRQ
jgi:hypothetical protein